MKLFDWYPSLLTAGKGLCQDMVTPVMEQRSITVCEIFWMAKPVMPRWSGMPPVTAHSTLAQIFSNTVVVQPFLHPLLERLGAWCDFPPFSWATCQPRISWVWIAKGSKPEH